MTQSHEWHDSFICMGLRYVTWLIYVRWLVVNSTHICYMTRYVTWLIYVIYDMCHDLCMLHDSLWTVLIYVTWLVVSSRVLSLRSLRCATWLSHTCDMTHFAWLSHSCDMTHCEWIDVRSPWWVYNVQHSLSSRRSSWWVCDVRWLSQKSPIKETIFCKRAP